jgi:hypothetical protein
LDERLQEGQVGASGLFGLRSEYFFVEAWFGVRLALAACLEGGGY